MFIERLLNQGNAPLLEQMLRFTSQRHKLLSENIVNLSTPGYRQKDMSLEKFQGLLRRRVDARNGAGPGATGFSDVMADMENPVHGILFHDNNNRSAEQLMSSEAKNAMMHNMAVELLRKQFESLESALKERVS